MGGSGRYSIFFEIRFRYKRGSRLKKWEVLYPLPAMKHMAPGKGF